MVEKTAPLQWACKRMHMLQIQTFAPTSGIGLFASRIWQLLTGRGKSSAGVKSTLEATISNQQKYAYLEVTDWTQGGRIKTAKGINHESMIHALKQDPCAYCGGKFPAGTATNTVKRCATIDHIKPLLRAHKGGGSGHWTNMTGCCSQCNSAKTNMKLIFFLLYRHRIGAEVSVRKFHIFVKANKRLGEISP